MDNIKRQIAQIVEIYDYEDGVVLDRDEALKHARLSIAYSAMDEAAKDGEHWEQAAEYIKATLDLIEDLEINYNHGDLVKITFTNMGIFVTAKMVEEA